MQSEYTQGASFAVGFSLIVGAILVILVVRWGRFYGLLRGIPALLIAAFALFALTYPLANMYYLNGGDIVRYFTTQWNRGVLGVWITSVFLGATSLMYIETFLAERIFTDTPLMSRRRRSWVSREPVRVLATRTYWTILAQYGIYLAAVCILWWSVVSGVRGTYIAVLSWALFFVVDDWQLLKTYILSGDIAPFHRLRITAFNILLAVNVPLAMSAELSSGYVYLTALGMAILMVLRYAPALIA